MVKKVEIHITEKCMYDCEFCSVNKRKRIEPTFEEIKRDIDLTLKENFSRITLTGGEPLLREDLIEIIRYAKKFYKGILIETHGYKLTEEKLKEMINAGVTEIKLSLHSHLPEIYEKITRRKGSFLDSYNALRILSNFCNQIEVSTNTVITKSNYNTVAQTINWINKEAPDLKKIRASYVRFYPIKDAKDYSKDCVVSLPEVKNQLESIKKMKIKKVFFENVPLCIADLETPKEFTWELYLSINGKITQGFDTRYYPKKCNSCKKKENCQGLHKYYSLYFDENFVKPFN